MHALNGIPSIGKEAFHLPVKSDRSAQQTRTAEGGAHMLTELIKNQAQHLSGTQNDYDRLMRDIGDASIVLLGEATHGTHEFYRERARITQRLIQEKDFMAIAVEADWPDAYRVNQYVRGRGQDRSAVKALSDFKRFPTWMWRNLEVWEFVEWLARYNAGQTPARKIGFYGLDLYSLHTSAEVVVRYLESMDPQAAQAARERYGCFDHFHQDMQEYGLMTAYGLSTSCQEAVMEQLLALQQHALAYTLQDGQEAEDEFFNAEQNARLAQNAEAYYRTMFQGSVSSWNLRDTHMVETLHSLLVYLNRYARSPKVVVWAHNSHVGDARATAMSRQHEVNIGQLTRQRYGEEVFNLGFSTHRGSVTAASEWDRPAEKKRVRPSLPGSWENLFHETGLPAFLLNLRNPDVRRQMHQTLLERAIGVIYLPKSERYSHYFEAKITDQFDAILHIDETQAVIPIAPTPEWELGELPETYPSAL
jgi:erythromycin esterase-like protein